MWNGREGLWHIARVLLTLNNNQDPVHGSARHGFHSIPLNVTPNGTTAACIQRGTAKS